MTDPPITQHDGAVTISGAALLASTYRCVLLGIRQRRHDGLPSADLQQLARELYRAHTDAVSLARREFPAAADDQPCSGCQNGGRVSVSEAAQLLRLSRRQVQRLVAEPRGGLGGIRVGRTWLLDRRAVLTLSERRAHDRTDRLPGLVETARRTAVDGAVDRPS